MMLPTDSLVRFQCVCKAWRDLIRDSMFIKKHLELRKSKGKGYLLSVLMDHDPDRAFTLICEETFEEAMEIAIPFQSVEMSLIVIGSCNGLLCLSDTERYGTALYLCNPSIRRYRVIDHPITGVVGSSDPKNDCVTLGFGYYDQTDDYKIIRFVAPGDGHDDVLDLGSKYHKTEENTKVEVYSSITNSWKDVVVENFSWSLLDVRSELVICDSVHWKAFYRDTNKDVLVILTFHLGNETFGQIRLPNYEADGEDLMEYVGLYKGKLSLFLFHQVVNPHPWQENDCYLWVMMEYGMEASWIKMLNISVHPGVVRPLVFTKNDEIIFADSEQDLVVCHFDSNTAKIVRLEERGYLNFTNYMDSLVLLEG
ncbi:F-box/kelch-repeat protein At3g06240-like [Sesamum indicum]|uniref:F-box/kelch-repeat protein At3g06240-like n=1 Tax=Sesamum indicum TaxID=4182 RepID=A0A6I9U1H7_SESIN|nr:F-box/kelch-repeat protein At3g06240-like [Sesamum indicum]